MTVYWFPVLPNKGYQPVEVEAVVWVDLHCATCGGDVFDLKPKLRPARLVRFVCSVQGGPIGVMPFRVQGELRGPGFSVSPKDGKLRFRLKCNHGGHEQPVSETEAFALLRERAGGNLPDRVLWRPVNV